MAYVAPRLVAENVLSRHISAFPHAPGVPFRHLRGSGARAHCRIGRPWAWGGPDAQDLQLCV